MTQSEHLQLVTGLEYEAAEKDHQARMEAQRYTETYCPYKIGDKIMIRKGSRWMYCVVKDVRYSRESTIPGMALLVVQPYTKYWKHEKRDGVPLHIKKREEIVELMPLTLLEDL